MKRGLLLALPLVFAGCDGDFLGIDVCSVDRDVYDEISASTSAVVNVLADDGDLEVRGRPGLTRVRVTGRACAQDRATLDDIDVVLQRSGDIIRVIAVVPDDWGSDDARLDLVVEVPADMIVDIEHTDGDIDVQDVRAAFILAESGSILVQDVTQDVEISDGSGDIRMSRIGGDVFVLDTSGHIDVREVDGLVHIEEDESGNIYVQDVLGDVYVREDGTGDIEVVDINGDFIVDYDSSGRITHRGVRGRVILP